MTEPQTRQDLEAALELAGPMQFCVGLVIIIGEEVERHGRVVLTNGEDSIGSQFVELMRELRKAAGR